MVELEIESPYLQIERILRFLRLSLRVHDLTLLEARERVDLRTSYCDVKSEVKVVDVLPQL